MVICIRDNILIVIEFSALKFLFPSIKYSSYAWKNTCIESNWSIPTLLFIMFLRCKSAKRKQHTLLINEIDERNQRRENLILMDKCLCCRVKAVVMEMAQNGDYVIQEDPLVALLSSVITDQIMEIFWHCIRMETSDDRQLGSLPTLITKTNGMNGSVFFTKYLMSE